MIDDSKTVFPINAINVLFDRFEMLEPASVPEADRIRVFRRPLRETDPAQSIGIYATEWNPDADSYEMRAVSHGFHVATVQIYSITIQGMVIDMDEERGMAAHSVMAKLMRSILLEDEPLRVGLAALSIGLAGKEERTMRWGVRRQRFLSNEMSGSWYYLSSMEAFLETETT